MGRLSPALRGSAGPPPIPYSIEDPIGDIEPPSYQDPIGLQPVPSYEDPVGLGRKPVYTRGLGAQPSER
jgi:hypothetical protein